jgi:hypothetical protein
MHLYTVYIYAHAPKYLTGRFSHETTYSSIIVGFLLAAMFFGTATVLANSERNISVTFRNIRLVINGQEHIPRDGAGNVVEPFIWQGTTYLPLRAVGNALGLEVDWDGDTSTVYLGPRGGGATAVVGYQWLDHMPHLNHTRGGNRNTITSWIPGNLSFDRGLAFNHR